VCNAGGGGYGGTKGGSGSSGSKVSILSQGSGSASYGGGSSYSGGLSSVSGSSGGFAGGIIPAAVQTRYSVDVRHVATQSEPIQPQTVLVDAGILPLTILFRSASSNINVLQQHVGSEAGEVQQTSSEDEPHRLVHEVTKPIIQEVREVITPYRRVVQEIKPVVEDIQTIVARGEARNTGVAATGYGVGGSSGIALSGGSSLGSFGTGSVGLSSGSSLGSFGTSSVGLSGGNSISSHSGTSGSGFASIFGSAKSSYGSSSSSGSSSKGYAKSA